MANSKDYIRNFDQLLDQVKKGSPQTLAVAVAQDEDVLKSVSNAFELGIIDGAFLIGDKDKIETIANDKNIDISSFNVVNETDNVEACNLAMQLVSSGKASLPMKGKIDTSIVLRALLNNDNGLRTDKLVCHVALLSVQGFDRMFILSDSAMTIAPTLSQKADLINACTHVAHAMGNKEPKVAVLCAVEKVNPKMPATLDAELLTKMNEEGKIKDCLVKGPLALDLAVSKESAKQKGIDHPVAGNADILIAPDIEAGNILNKSMEYFAKCEKAGCIMGAKSPLVLTSRASSDVSKMNSIALGVLVAQSLEGEV